MSKANMSTKLVLEKPTLEFVAQHIRDRCRQIIVLTGAGISTASGIPDFRSPGTGLYANLEKYQLPYPEAIFDLKYFRHRPEPFFTLAKELYPGNYAPTLTHYFIRLLAEKKLLKRNYTQNIDALERLAGIDPEYLVEAHGAFNDAHCIKCRKEHRHSFVREHVFSDKIPECDRCGGLVKPDIVFFGEALPERYHTLAETDFDECDLLIVMGTSLQVGPFNRLVTFPDSDTPRLLINMEDPQMFFNWKSPLNRDVKVLDNCDNGCLQLAKLLGWEEELVNLRNRELAELRANTKYRLSGAPAIPEHLISQPKAMKGREIVMLEESNTSSEEEEEEEEEEEADEVQDDKEEKDADVATELEEKLQSLNIQSKRD